MRLIIDYTTISHPGKESHGHTTNLIISQFINRSYTNDDRLVLLFIVLVHATIHTDIIITYITSLSYYCNLNIAVS